MVGSGFLGSDSPGPASFGRRSLLVAAAGCLLGSGDRVAHGAEISDHTQSAEAWWAMDPRSIVALRRPRRQIALTFDDGPDPHFTPQVLEILRRYRATATFFLIGRSARRYPQLVRRILREGHQVGNHTRDHLWLDRLDGVRIAAQVDGCTRDLAAVGAGPVSLFRPPRGWTSPDVARVVHRRGLRSAFWTVCLESHLHHGTAAAVASLRPALLPGAIVLCHDGGHLDGPNPQSIDRTATVQALPELLETIRGLGLQPAPLPAAVSV